MASLAEREGLRGKVQCIYFDPPYGIKFNSNFQWSTTSRDVKDGAKDHITREPEQVRAFRDTWRDGIHSYLTYLRDRLTVARDLLTESGSIFVQIGDENVHRVRALMDEVFGDENFLNQIFFEKTTGDTGLFLNHVGDYIIWYSKKRESAKYRQIYFQKSVGSQGASQYNLIQEPSGFRRPALKEELLSPAPEMKFWAHDTMMSQRPPGSFPVEFEGRKVFPGRGFWKTGESGTNRLNKSSRLTLIGNTLRYVRFLNDFPVYPVSNEWRDTVVSGFGIDKTYVVQTLPKVIERCISMTTDPGDLVLDPTCGSGTTATVAEQWGRRWITIDTSRVAIALARSRLMGARYPYYLLADSVEGQRKEAEVTRSAPRTAPTRGDVRQGFVYERVPHITLKSIANNAEIDVIWETWQATLEPLRQALNAALGTTWEEWQIPREAGEPWAPPAAKALAEYRKAEDPHLRVRALQTICTLQQRLYTDQTLPKTPHDPWAAEPTRLHAEWWQARIARQKEIDASIAAKADVEYLYDRPYQDKDRVRVAGPFTVESLSPHRTLAVDWDDELVDLLELSEKKHKATTKAEALTDFAQMVLENLKTAGVQQAHKEGRIAFTSLTGWPGTYICAEGTFLEGEVQRRAGIFIGPEFGTVSRPDLVAAAREAGDAAFDVLIACAFAYDAHSAEFARLGRVPVLKARMNPDLHMAADLKATGAGNLFVVFGEPDIRIEDAGDGMIRVQVFGVDVFKPQTGEVVSEGTDGIALWMLDTDYNEESFFVRHAYFLGANDPYKALKTTLKAEIDEDAWATLHSAISRPFPKPASGRIAVKVINHLGDEVMKIFSVG
ncbi:site-specific DNA-methyltransferase [Zavarzinia sp. CC-PAN008]